LFGVPYAHPHPVEADLSGVRNSAGLPIATELDGTPVAEFVIDEAEQQARQAKMKTICRSCHSTSWVDNHFKRLDNTIQKTNDITAPGHAHIITDVGRGIRRRPAAKSQHL
jgi:hydroxylamine dehydrogenase